MPHLLRSGSLGWEARRAEGTQRATWPQFNQAKVKDKSKSQSPTKDLVCWGFDGKEVHSKKAKHKDKCPGKDKTCHKCQAKGHLAKYCPKDQDKSKD